MALLTVAVPAFAAEEKVEGPRTVVFAPSGLRAAAERARDVLEAAIPVYEKHLPYRLPEGERLVLRLYERQEDYEAAVTEAGAPLLARHGAATVDSTTETLVAVKPRIDADYLAAVGGLSERTRHVIAHEGVHQFARRAGAPHVELWPDWYSEGMAEWIGWECLRGSGDGDAAVPIVVDDARHRVRDALGRGRMLRLERVLHARMSEFERIPVLYAHVAELYRLLASDGEKLRRLHEAVRAVPAIAGPTWTARQLPYAAACVDALAKIYGPLPALEEAWVRQTRASQPSWFEDGRNCERVGEEIVCAGPPGWNALLLSASPPSGPFSLSFEVNVLPFGDRQADVCLGYEQRDDPRFLKIALGPGYVTLLAFSDGRWQERFRANASVSAGVLGPGKWIPIRVRADKARVRVESGAATLLDAPVPPGFDALSGVWGVGATDSACRFRRVEVGK